VGNLSPQLHDIGASAIIEKTAGGISRPSPVSADSGMLINVASPVGYFVQLVSAPRLAP